MRSYIKMILEMRGPEPKTPPVETIEDRVLAIIFTALTTPPLDPRERAKSYHSIRNSKGKDAPSRKKKHTDLEVARSFVN